MIAVAMNKINKNYGGKPVLENVSLSIHEGERIGFIGRNGEGKSTILKIIAQTENADSGEVAIKKELTVGLLEQVPDFPENKLARDFLELAFSELNERAAVLRQLEHAMTESLDEKVLQRYGRLQTEFIELGGYQMESEINKVLTGLGIESLYEQAFGSLSGGEKTKLALAQVLLRQPDILLLDEPTNHLDLHAVEWMTTFVRNYFGTVVIVSHDRYFLDECVQKIIELENHEIYTYHGNFSAYMVEREARLLREFTEYKDQQKKIAKMRQAAKRLREWAMMAKPPNAAFFKKAKSIERAIERMVKVKRPVLDQKTMNVGFTSGSRSGKDVIIAQDMSKFYNERIIFDTVQLHIRYGERIAIVGENGVGKSTLLKLMMQSIQPDDGTIQLGSNVSFAYLSQQFTLGKPEQTVLDAFRDYVMVSEFDARHMLASFLFYGEMVFRKVKNLSGGEQMRLRLATFINLPVNTLFFDEPTNHLDIASREVLEDAIDAFGGTVICISHDRYFMNRLFTRTLWLENSMVESYDGNYQYAYEKRKQK